jgi:bifunctional DNA-binding transcriptional regulator/antitoxin component of YhaV-PrlF toxin-antitoxin module
MTPSSPGYSGTPLAKKLGIKAGSRVFVVRAPDGYRELLEPLPDGVVFTRRVTAAVDIAQVFTVKKSELVRHLESLRKVLKPEAAIWISWPKKASGVATEVTEHTIRDVALPIGLVDIKVCAVTDVWSGLKLVVRKDLR